MGHDLLPWQGCHPHSRWSRPVDLDQVSGFGYSSDLTRSGTLRVTGEVAVERCRVGPDADHRASKRLTTNGAVGAGVNTC